VAICQYLGIEKSGIEQRRRALASQLLPPAAAGQWPLVKHHGRAEAALLMPEALRQAASADCRLRPLRSPAPGRLMARTEILELMAKLKLYGMRAA
jgi:hypothetical protein